MKLTAHQPAPDFTTKDAYGKTIRLSDFKGQKVYLAFERNVGCPICNLRTHELLKKAETFSAKNIIVLMIYESSAEKMREYLGDTSYPFQFIPDPENLLYKKYGIEQSVGKFLKSMFNGLMRKVKAGNKLFKQPIKQDGHMTTINSEFIVDERGYLSKVHYANFIGDHLPIEEVLR